MFLERMMGVDLRCGGGRVAALTCSRRVIHSRSRSTPSRIKTTAHPKGEPLFLERMMGVEPTLPAWEAEVLPMNYIRV